LASGALIDSVESVELEDLLELTSQAVSIINMKKNEA
jgi:hypothetical protein